MATRFSSTLVSDITTDARFQAVAQFVEDTLVTTGGWLLSTETGSTAPASLTHPTTTNSKQGFRVYKTNDGLTQVFMRIDYGATAAVAGNGFGMWITLGTGSNGAGGLTGVFFNGGGSVGATVGTATGGTVGTTGAVNCYGSAGTGRVQLGLFIGAAAGGIVAFSIERTKDGIGADTSDGILITCTGGGSVSIWAITHTASVLCENTYLVVAGGLQPSIELGLNYVLTRNNPSETFGSDVGVGLVIHFKGVSQQPGLGICVVNSSDMTAESTFTMTIYGATRTYQQLNSLQPGRTVGATVSAVTTQRVCMRYD